MMIYKVLRPHEWSHLMAEGQTLGSAADQRDGFVHFSTAKQLGDTLARHFSDEGDLVLLACEDAVLGDDLHWEPSRGGALFPHLYRPLTLGDIVWSRDIGRTADGHDTGPLE